MTALLNRNYALFAEKLQIEGTFLIAALRTHSLQAIDLMRQSRRTREDSLRIQVFLCQDQNLRSELSCLLFEMLDEKGRDKSTID